MSKRSPSRSVEQVSPWDLTPPFDRQYTNLAQIKKLGWRLHRSIDKIWFVKDREDSREDRQYVPDWIYEMIEQARAEGREEIRSGLRVLLDIPPARNRPIKPTHVVAIEPGGSETLEKPETNDAAAGKKETSTA